MNLSGCGTALVTPFAQDGSLDEPALRAHVQWQIESGVSLLIPCGTTGEASTLTEQEWLRVIEITIEAAAGRVPIFAGCTHNATAQAVANAKKLAKLTGLTGILTANPYYNRPGQEGQYQHFRAIAEAVDLPILLYNIPGRTATNLLPETVLRLAELKNIVGIKESSGVMGQITELLAQAPADFKVFAGDDALALPVIALGGVGLVSVASNAIPGPMSQMIAAALTGTQEAWATARQLNARYFALMQAHFIEPSPSPIKTSLALLGRGSENLRLPMVPVTDATRTKLRTLLTSLGLLP
ncbi:4-hydroxy-tetrahydrodipicolinate synthase [Granulicella sp. 5B5]|uniref:4-hydroxy-tetrahydrodipicolinate synthase n=1 Tax=Granulicella sp. 5B5 TaxID=1617967 RepID=UPI0015F3F39A|nr:4-hydroxy-tetrahydrodipicolinate synthase [Granulicella sp. 5B5]QMV17929.1 4-hydroxy-tetrahydrodipicolinate synthase [Granulicella sp. 5B5]